MKIAIVQPLDVDALPVVAGWVIPISRLTCSSIAVSRKLPCSSSREMPADAQQTEELRVSENHHHFDQRLQNAI
eukprot:COSAG02_NODE_2049_length_10007_cov_226.930057_10_plen_74_part_00